MRSGKTIEAIEMSGLYFTAIVQYSAKRSGQKHLLTIKYECTGYHHNNLLWLNNTTRS